MISPRRFACSAALLLFVPLVHAANTPATPGPQAGLPPAPELQGDALNEALGACAARPSVDTRLACYDELAIRQGLHVGGTQEGVEDPAADAVKSSRILQRWDQEEVAQRGRFALLVHRPNYLMPFSWNFSPNQQPFPLSDLRLANHEAKLQLSIKVKLWEDVIGNNGDIWATYTQQSFWQAYKKSSPFRDTVYEPSLMFAWRTNFNLLGMRGRLLGLEFDHQSNGRAQNAGLSRSWNRVIGKAVFERGPFVAEARAWWRIPEPAATDDNPDIENYLGNGDLLLSWEHGGHTVSAQLRSNFDFSTPRGATELSWSFPINRSDNLRGYLQYYLGYGESLIDYNARSNRIGIGLAFSDWY